MKYIKKYRLFESTNEIDRILDKIIDQGIDSLTADEKSKLDNYKDDKSSRYDDFDDPNFHRVKKSKLDNTQFNLMKNMLTDHLKKSARDLDLEEIWNSGFSDNLCLKILKNCGTNVDNLDNIPNFRALPRGVASYLIRMIDSLCDVAIDASTKLVDDKGIDALMREDSGNLALEYANFSDFKSLYNLDDSDLSNFTDLFFI